MSKLFCGANPRKIGIEDKDGSWDMAKFKVKIILDILEDKNMEIRIETCSYNERRYGRPWIAKVDFRKSTKGDFFWGDWTGDHYNGGEGVLTIDAKPGDIIATGQKDIRKPRNSAPHFSIVGADGELEDIGDKGAAYKYYLEHKDAAPDLDALRKERETLVARITEIDAILNN